jgi:hypothetical protein
MCIAIRVTDRQESGKLDEKKDDTCEQIAKRNTSRDGETDSWDPQQLQCWTVFILSAEHCTIQPDSPADYYVSEGKNKQRSQQLILKIRTSVNSEHTVTQKVAGSIPDEVIDFFLNLTNRSSRTMTLGLIQPLTEINKKKSSYGPKSGRRVSLTT